MNSISVRQNSKQNITRLQAQRHLYSSAKKLSTIRLVLAGATSIVGVIALVCFQESNSLAAFAGILVSFVNIGLLESWQRRVQKSAADIQELFDCDVLDLTWNFVFARSQPVVEYVTETAKKTNCRNNSSLANWYPNIVDSVRIHQARVICQRINCRWDSNLRRQYARILWAVFSLVILIAILIGLSVNMDMQKFFLAVVAPLTPTLLWVMREAQCQFEAASAIDQLNDVVNALWMDILKNDLTENQAASRSRELQNGILIQRRVNPLVFEWIYRLDREKGERTADVIANDMVTQINNGVESTTDE